MCSVGMGGCFYVCAKMVFSQGHFEFGGFPGIFLCGFVKSSHKLITDLQVDRYGIGVVSQVVGHTSPLSV